MRRSDVSAAITSVVYFLVGATLGLILSSQTPFLALKSDKIYSRLTAIESSVHVASVSSTNDLSTLQKSYIFSVPISSPIVTAPPFPNDNAPSSWNLMSTQQCVVSAYYSSGGVEFVFFLSIILKGVPNLCSCRLDLRPRNAFATDVRENRIGEVGVLHATHGVADNEIAALRDSSTMALRVILVHLSDESEAHNVSAYKYFRKVWRNYAAVKSDRIADMGYLSSNPTHSDASLPAVLWLPLGFSNSFQFFLEPTLSQKTSLRPLAWSWAGSSGNKPLREDFLRNTRQNETLLSLGRLHEFTDFWDKSKSLSPEEYSTLLYSSRVIPCPDGNSAEQFRIWEAFGAGAVPIVTAGRPSP